MSQNENEKGVRIVYIKEREIEEREPPSEEEFEVVYEWPIDGSIKLRSEDIEKIKSKISAKRIIVLVAAIILLINILFPAFLLDDINARIVDSVDINISRTISKKPPTYRVKLSVNDDLAKMLNSSGIFHINVYYHHFERKSLLLLIVRTSYLGLFSSMLVEPFIVEFELNQSSTRNLIRLVSERSAGNYLIFEIVLLLMVNLVILVLLAFVVKAWIFRRQKYIVIDI